MLARPDMEQLAQRVIARYHLAALSRRETRDYIQHRLMVAGHKGGAVFDERAAREVHTLSQGVPRRINLLCDRALLGAYAHHRNLVSRQMVRAAAQEVFMPARASAPTAPTGLPTLDANSGGQAGRTWLSWAPWGVAGASLEEAVSAVSLYALGPYWLQAIEPDYGVVRRYSVDRLSRPERKAIFARMTSESGRALWETLNWWLDPLMTTSLGPGRLKVPSLVIAGARDVVHPASTVQIGRAHV